jgi:hypothetical protein
MKNIEVGQFWSGKRRGVREVTIVDGIEVAYRGDRYSGWTNLQAFRAWANQLVEPTWKPAPGWDPLDSHHGDGDWTMVSPEEKDRNNGKDSSGN